MTNPDLDPDSVVHLLRGDVPSPDDRARIRARLAAAGVLASSVPVAQAAAASATATVSKAGLSLASKLAIGVSTALVVGSAALFISPQSSRRTPPHAQMAPPPSNEASLQVESLPAEGGLSAGDEAHEHDVQARESAAKAPVKRRPRARDKSDEKTQSTLAAETELVSRALSLLRANSLAEAEALLRAHEQRFPQGALRRERELAFERLRARREQIKSSP